MIYDKIERIYESSLNLSDKPKEQKFAQQDKRETGEDFDSLFRKECDKLKNETNL